ncbi:MAG: hypothetical protein R3C30_12505 [Hyphomonadaceae bacterium]
MSVKQAAKSGVGALIIIALAVIAAVLLIPGFATILGGLIASLWVTVMSAVVGILGGLMGS